MILPIYLAISLGLGLCVRRLYQALFSPLAKIPNAHTLAPWTGLWVLWLRYQHIAHETLYEAHNRQGPLIRVGPNELSVNCIDDGVKAIYNSKRFLKHRFYKAFENFDATPMFATLDPRNHAIKRKRISNVFSKSYLQSSPDLNVIVKEVIFNRLIPRLDKFAVSEQNFDLMSILHAFVADTATSYNWGLGNGTQFLLDEKQHSEFLEVYNASRPESLFFFPVELPWLIKGLSRLGWTHLTKECPYSSDAIDAWCLDLCDKAEATLASQQSLPPGYCPVVYQQLKESLSKENISSLPSLTAYRTLPATRKRHRKRHRKLSSDTEEILTQVRSPQQIEIAAELLDHTVATNDVLSTTLTYICWEVGRHADIQQRLHDEVQTLRPHLTYDAEHEATLPNAKDLDALPLLQAVIMETLRHWPINPGMEPRMTPEDTTLAGYSDIPANVRVSAMPYTLHRNAEVYPDPWSWHPERWLPDISDRGEYAGNGEAERWFWAFSSGSRMCIGNHLSMHLMKLLIASIYINFRMTIVEDAGMEEQVQGFLAVPMAEKLIVKLHRWD